MRKILTFLCICFCLTALGNPYRTLGVNPNDSLEDIKKAYRKMIRKYHPDLNSSHEAVQKSQEINAAYEEIKQAHSDRSVNPSAAPATYNKSTSPQNQENSHLGLDDYILDIWYFKHEVLPKFEVLKQMFFAIYPDIHLSVTDAPALTDWLTHTEKPPQEYSFLTGHLDRKAFSSLARAIAIHCHEQPSVQYQRFCFAFARVLFRQGSTEGNKIILDDLLSTIGTPISNPIYDLEKVFLESLKHLKADGYKKTTGYKYSCSEKFTRSYK